MFLNSRMLSKSFFFLKKHFVKWSYFIIPLMKKFSMMSQNQEVEDGQKVWKHEEL